jgi:peroxidase
VELILRRCENNLLNIFLYKIFFILFKHSWCLLFSHPADFTSVCSTELGRIAVHQHEFLKRNVKILAHSVDEVESHVEWVNDIRDYCKDICGDFPFPIIADPTRELAVKFGMFDANDVIDSENAKTVRSLFIISPDKRVRLMMHYPASCGRNVDEILRCIDSLQLTDRLKCVATPANWIPGDKIMITSDANEEDVAKLGAQIDEVQMPSGKVYIRTTTNY